MKIKILMSLGSLGIGGNEIFVMNFFRHIDKSKFQVDFVIFDDTRLDFYNEVTTAGSKVYIIKPLKKNKISLFFYQMQEVKKLLKSNHYDIVHCHSCSFFGILRSAIPAHQIKDTKVISHAHNPGMPKNNPIDKGIRMITKIYLSSIVDMGLSCSDIASESKYTKKFMKSNKYAIIRNAIETDKYKFDLKKKNKIRKQYNLSDEILVGNVGRLAYQKNQLFLLEIFSEIHKVNSNTKLIIIGGGELETELKCKTKKLNIADMVIFTGSISNTADYYSAMNVFVMPSHYEGLPFTAVEAQVNGLRCVFSDKITRMADISETSVFLPLNNASEWVTPILNAATSRIPTSKAELICNQYDLKTESKRLQQLYMELMKDKK